MEQLKTIGFQVHMLSNMLARYLCGRTQCAMMENITGSGGWILGYLARNSEREIFQRDLEEKFSIRRSTASKSITLMEKKGLLRRERVDYDARLRRLVLTEKGRELHGIMTQNIEEAEKQLESGLTEQEKNEFLRILEKMKKNLERSDEMKGANI